MPFGIKTEVEKQSRKQTLDDFNKLINELKKQANDNPINFKIDNINKGFEKIKNDINESNNDVKALGGSFAGITSHFLKLVGIAETFRFTMDKIKDGISFINQVNKQSTNIRMVTGMSEDEMNSYVKSVNAMAIQLKDDTNNLLDSSEVFLRAGRNIKNASELVELSTMASKVSGQTQEQTANQVIQIQNGWKMTNAEIKGAMDGLSALDQKSSSSLAEISTALGRTSASASEVGEKFNDLAAYITVVSDVSKKSASTIGESFRSIYARMTNLKLGKLDEEGAAISDVEKSLHKVNINLRLNETTFRDMNSVFKDVMKSWGGWNDIQRNMVANAIASSRQKENFIILMNNQAKIQDYLNYQAESAGTIQKQYNVYLESTEGRMNQLKATSQRFWLQVLDSNVIKGGISELTRIVNAFEWIATKGKIAGLALVALTAEFIALSKGVELVSLAFKAVQSFSIISMLANPMFLLGTAIAGAVVAISAFSRANAKAREEMEATKKATDDLTQAMKNFDKAGMESGIKTLEEKENKLKDILRKKEELKKELDNLATEDVQKKYGGGDVEGKIRGALGYLDQDLKKTIKTLKDSGLAIDENTYSIVQLAEAKQRLNEINTVENIKKEAEAEWNNRQAISALYTEYQNLSQAENQSATVKTRLSQVSNELKDKVKGVTTAMSDDGVVRVKNIGLVEQQIDYFNKENLTLKGLTETRLNDYRNHLTSEKMKTQCTYAEVKNRIEMMSKEYSTAMENINPRMNFLGGKWKDGTITDEERRELENLQNGAMYTSNMFAGAIDRTKGVISEIDEIMKSGGASLDIPSTTVSDPPKIKDDGKKKKSKQEIEDYKLKLDLTKQEEQLQKNINREKEKANLLIEKANIKEQISLKQRQIDLAIQESTNDDKIYQKKLQQMNDVKSLLGIFKFNIDDDGNVINAQDKLKEMTTYANSLTDNKAKKEHIEQIKDIESEINKLYELGDALQNTSKKKLELTNQVSKLNTEIMNLKVDELANKFNDTDIVIKGKLEDLDLKGLSINDDDLNGQLDILNQRKLLVQDQINAKLEELESLTHIEVTSEDEKKSLDNRYRQEQDSLRELQKTYAGFENSIKDNYNKRLDVSKDIESKITDMFKKQVEERKKSIEEEYDKRVEYFNKVKKLYNQENNEVDRNKELNENQGDLDKLRNDYQTSLRDTSEAGKLRTEQLRKAMEDQGKKINDLITKQERDRYNESLDNKISELEEKKKSELKSIDDTWTPQKIASMVKQAMSDGTFKDIEGNIKNVKDAYSEFLDKFENGMSMSGQKLKEEFIKNFDIATESVKTLDNSSQNFTNIFDDGLKNIGTTVANIMIPNFEKLKDIIEKIDMSKFGIDGITSTKVTLPQSTNISSIANNVSNVRNQPVSLKTDVNMQFGDVSTSMTTKDFESKISQCKNKIAEVVDDEFRRQMYIR